MVNITNQMIQLLLECKIIGDEDSYEEAKKSFAEQHIAELKLEGLRKFLESKPKKVYDGKEI